MKKSDEDPLVRSAALSPRLTPVNKRSPTLLDPHHVHLGRQPNQVENDDDVAATTDTSPALPSDMYEPVHVPTYIAFMVFGLASWIMTNTTYIELGSFMLKLPEKLSIFSYAIFALQTANIYPMLYMYCNPLHRHLKLSHAVWILLFVGFLACLLMMFTWDVTANVLGANHSVGVCASAASPIHVVKITNRGALNSDAVLDAYGRHGERDHQRCVLSVRGDVPTSALSTGEGLSGAIPAIIGAWQEPYAEKMKFSVSTFYSICGLLVLSSFIAFMYLEYHPTARRIRKRHMDNDDDTAVEDSEKGASTAKSDEGASDEAKLIAKKVKANNIQPEDEAASTNDTSANLRRQVFSALWRELACLTLLAALGYGMLPSTSSFLFARYAPTNQPQLASQYQTYCSVTTLVVDPLARFVTSFVRVYSVYLFTWLLLLGGSFLLACSMISAPPFSGDDSPNGYLFPLLSSIAFAAVYAYTQTMLFLAIKREMDRVRNPQYSELAYQWSGMLIQIGAFAGTMAIFPLTVIYPELFQSQ